MNRIALVMAVAVLWTGVKPASAFWFDGGAKEITGAQNYNGFSAYGTLGADDYSLRPAFNSYHNNASSGTFNTYSLRLGYDTTLIGLGLTGGATPSVNGYNNKFVGADATISLTPTGEGARQRINGRAQATGPAQGAGLARVDIGGAATYISHSDHYGSMGQLLGAAAHLSQTDLTGSAGIALLGSLLSVDITKSLYNQKPGQINMRAPRVENIVGLTNIVQGFPNTSTNVKLLFGVAPVVKPFVGYTHTSFEAGEANSNAYTAGVAAELQILEVSAAYERYVQQGQTDQNFLSVGGNIRF